ncbi:MAG: DMT family transporter [Pseudobdellovibrio sp.]
MLHTSLYFLALLCLSSAPNWAKLNNMPVEVLGFYRLSIAAALLGIWLIIKHPLPKPKFNKTILWVILSGTFFFLHLWTYKYAAKNTTVSNTMVIFSSNPIWASLGAVIFFKEILSRRIIFAYLLALSGIYLLVAHDLNLSSGTSLGDWAAVASAAFYAAYMLTGKKARHYYDNIYYAVIQYSVAATLFGICVFANDSSLSGYDTISWVSVMGLVLLPTLLGHLSFTYLVHHMNISLMTCGKQIEPVLASIMAFFIFHEKISEYAWISFSLTLLSVLILFYPQLKNSAKKLLQI